MPYQDNNNRINPTGAGKTSITPQFNVVDKNLQYKLDYNKAEQTANNARAIVALGKGVEDVNTALEKRGEEKAIELIYNDNIEGKNKHEWKEAIAKQPFLEKFNPYLKDNYNRLSAQDYAQKALADLYNDPEAEYRDEAYINNKIAKAQSDLIGIMKDSGIDVRQSAKYLEQFNTQSNMYKNRWVNTRAENQMNLSYAKISNTVAKGVRATVYNSTKENINDNLNNFLQNTIKEHNYLPAQQLLSKVIYPSLEQLISNMDDNTFMPLTEVMNAYRNIKIDGVELESLVPDFDNKIRQAYKNKRAELYADWRNEQAKQETIDKLNYKNATKDFMQMIINAKKSGQALDYDEITTSLAEKYNIFDYKDSLLADGLKHKDLINKLNRADDINDNPAIYKQIASMYVTDNLNENILIDAMQNDLISADTALKFYERLVNKDKKLTNDELKKQTAAYKTAYKYLYNPLFGGTGTKNFESFAKVVGKDKAEEIQEALQDLNIQVEEGSISPDIALKSIKLIDKQIQELKTTGAASKRVRESDPIFNANKAKETLLRKVKRSQLGDLKDTKSKQAVANNLRTIGLFETGVNLRVTSAVEKNRTVNGRTENHNSYDVAVPTGTKLRMPHGTSGKVIAMGNEKSMGNYMLVQNLYNGDYMMFMHLDSFNPALDEGSIIKANSFLARTGNTGFSTGPHLDVSFYRADLQSRLSDEEYAKRLKLNQPQLMRNTSEAYDKNRRNK